MVRSDPGRFLGLPDPPDDKPGDDDVGHERDGEQGRSDVLDSCDEGGLAGCEVGEFPDRHRDQCFFFCLFVKFRYPLFGGCKETYRQSPWSRGPEGR